MPCHTVPYRTVPYHTAALSTIIASRVVAVMCYSADTVNPGGMIVPTEYLNDQIVPGLPSHKFVFKPNMPIMLLRNLNPAQGLCNGTRLITTEIRRGKRIVVARIITGTHAGRLTIIPRINLSPNEELYPFAWTRRQFPIRASFVMTIHKSQGQTLRRVGIVLENQCFAHGQFYVAASRVGSPDEIKFVVAPDPGDDQFWVHNIVIQQAMIPR